MSVTPSTKIFRNGSISGILRNINITKSEINAIRNSYQKFEQFVMNNSKNSINSAFVFQMQPINHSNPCIIIHVIPSNSGKSNPNIVSKLSELKNVIEKNNYFKVLGYAADGDNSYRHFLKQQVYNENNDIGILFFSDYLHLLKRSRYWFLKHLNQYAHDINQFKNDFCNQYNLPSIVMSDEKITKMHDSLPIRLFDIKVLIKAIDKGHNRIFQYLLPWSLFMISINNDHISVKSRCKYLKLASLYLSHFSYLYDNNLITYTKGTIISLLKIFKSEQGLISLNRLSSNPLEHSFGVLRMKAKNHDSINKFISDIKRVNFIRLHKRDYVKTVIRHRVSDFGKTINLNGTFCQENLTGLLSSIAKFIFQNRKEQLFEDFTKEMKEVANKEPIKISDTLCSTKEITLNPSSQTHIRGRQEMDQSGRKYCAWTKKEEKNLLICTMTLEEISQS